MFQWVDLWGFAGARLQGVGGAALDSCGLRAGASVNRTRMLVDWDVGDLEAGSTPFLSVDLLREVAAIGGRCWTPGFPTERCIVTRRWMLFTSPVSGLNVGCADVYSRWILEVMTSSGCVHHAES